MEAAGTDSPLGRSLPRIGAEHYVNGTITYTADLAAQASLRLVVVRSACAHGELLSIDARDALAVAGVHAVFTGEDARRLTGPTPHFIDPSVRGGNRADVRCLAIERVRYVGEPVAAVVATRAAAARAGAGRVDVRCAPLPALSDPEAALAADAIEMYPGWGGNVMLDARYGAADVSDALAASEHRLSEEISLQRTTTAPIEPRACVAEWDAAASRLLVHANTQNPHQLRTMIATALGLQEASVHVIAGQVGGAFGLKMAGHAEDVLVAMVARELRQSVAWVEDRRECFLSSGREQRHRVEVGFACDGRLLALHDEILTDVGAASAQPGWAMSNLAALTLPTGYRLQAISAHMRAVVTNKPPWIASRGFGKEAANFVMERVLDMVAARLALDPAEVRRRNLLRAEEMPYRTAPGLNIDSGDYHRVLDHLLRELRYEGWRARQAAARREGRHVGIGLAFELTPEAGNNAGVMSTGYDTSTVRLDSDGRALVLTGVTSPGGGNDTGIAQIVAAELGLSVAAVDVVQGDTERCPPGFGNYSGRSTLLGGSAAALAARELSTRLLAAAATVDGSEPGALRLERDAVWSEAGRRVMAIGEAVVLADGDGAIEATCRYQPENTSLVRDDRGRFQPYPTYSNAVMGAVVEVDVPTGLVQLLDFAVCHDCGVIINPALVEGQMRGAVAMGLGGAMSEALVYDIHGALSSDRFKTYLLPRAPDLTPIRIVHEVTPSPFTLLGTKGAGEAGVGGSEAALANAVADALAPFGVVVRSLPVSAPAVRAMIDAAGAPR
jgi:carbon-monoxide dehydrogenase large subunit